MDAAWRRVRRWKNQTKTTGRIWLSWIILIYILMPFRIFRFWVCFASFWMSEVLVMQWRILRDELLPVFATVKQKVSRSSELKDASLRRTCSKRKGNVGLNRIETFVVQVWVLGSAVAQCQVYPYGSYNCCRRPKGICRIRPGKASCCSWPLQLGRVLLREDLQNPTEPNRSQQKSTEVNRRSEVNNSQNNSIIVVKMVNDSIW